MEKLSLTIGRYTSYNGTGEKVESGLAVSGKWTDGEEFRYHLVYETDITGIEKLIKGYISFITAGCPNFIEKPEQVTIDHANFK